jgi:large subunit ribosomal protein L30
MTTTKKEETRKPASAALEELEKTVGLRPRKAKPAPPAAPRREESKAAPRATTLRIRLVKSGICAPNDQKLTLLGLGLRKLNHEVVRPDSPAIRGMVRKVRHLVEMKPTGE